MLVVLFAAAGAAGVDPAERLGGARRGPSLRAELRTPGDPRLRPRSQDKWADVVNTIVGRTRKANRDTRQRAREAAELAVAIAGNLSIVTLPTPAAAGAAENRTAAASVVACRASEERACGFQTEVGAPLDCGSAQSARAVYAKWVPPIARVLEVGARYGQATCLLAQRLNQGALVSVEPDRLVYPALEKNLRSHNCTNVQLVKGVVGPRDLYFTRAWDGVSSVTSAAPQSRLDSGTGLPAPSGNPVVATSRVPATHYEALGLPVDTLIIDCNGCFEKFLEDSPNIVGTLRLVIVHDDNAWPGEHREVARLLGEGWNLLDSYHHHKVLCRGDQRCEMVDPTCATAPWPDA